MSETQSLNVSERTTQRLRIAFVTNGFPVTSEPFIALQAAQLVERGHDVQIFGLSNLPASRDASSERVRSVLEQRATNVAFPESTGARLAAAASSSVRTARQAGLRKLPILRPDIYRRSWRDLSAVFQAEAIANQAPFDIIHCQFATLAEPVFKLIDGGLLSGKVIAHLRGYDISEVIQALGPQTYDFLWPRADHILAVCHHFRDLAVGLGCASEKISIARSGLDLSSFPYRLPLPLGPGPVRLVGVGRLTARKGFHTLIKTLPMLEKAGIDARLTLIGEGEERQSLTDLAAGLGVEQRLHLAGAMSHAQIAQELIKHHIFVGPSEISPAGGMDGPLNTLKEAMAVGVPVCATDHGGIPDLVKDGETGALAREADADDLCRALQELIEAHAQWPTITEAARQLIEDEYAIENVTSRLETIYHSVLNT